MRVSSSMLAGLGAGAGLIFFLDPERGARRRALARDKAIHTAGLTRRALGTAGRDARHRTYGTAASVGRIFRHDAVDDTVLVERVRAKLGRFASHAHAIDVSATNGTITLRGPVLDREAEPLVRAVRRVRGVSHVDDRLERHEQAGNLPSLQGGRGVTPGDRLDVLQTAWAPTTRVLVGVAGAALVASGAIRRGGAGATAALLGLGLLARAASNLPVNRLFGTGARRRAVDLQKTINIDAPVEAVYAFWSQYENFPRFMSRVLEVRPSEKRASQSHWKIAGPAGVPVEFDAETTRVIPRQMIAWKTLPDAAVGHAGIVRFDPEPDGGTRVHIRMSYNPPAGWFGHGVAAAFGADPKSSMDEDLVRMKTLIETGRAPRDAAQRAAPKTM